MGANDGRVVLFKSVYPLDIGVSCNGYLVLGEKTTLLAGVDNAVALKI